MMLKTLHSRQFDWFHNYLQVAFGVIDIQVVYLDAKSYKVLDPSKVEEVKVRVMVKEIARISSKCL